MIVTHVSLGEQELAYSLQDKLVIVRKEQDTVNQHKQMQSMVKAQGTAAQEVEEGELQQDHNKETLARLLSLPPLLWGHLSDEGEESDRMDTGEPVKDWEGPTDKTALERSLWPHPHPALSAAMTLAMVSTFNF